MIYTSVHLFVDYFVQLFVLFDDFRFIDAVSDGLLDPSGHVRVIWEGLVCSQFIYMPAFFVDLVIHVGDGLLILLRAALLHDVSQQFFYVHLAQPCHEQSLVCFCILEPALADDGTSEKIGLGMIVFVDHLSLELLLRSLRLVFSVELL